MLRSQRLAGVQVNNSFHVPKDEVLCSLHTVAFPATMSPCSPSLLQVHCEQRVLPTLKCYVNKDVHNGHQVSSPSWAQQYI